MPTFVLTLILADGDVFDDESWVVGDVGAGVVGAVAEAAADWEVLAEVAEVGVDPLEYILEVRDPTPPMAHPAHDATADACCVLPALFTSFSA